MENAQTTTSPHARKRTRAQREADLLLIEDLALKGSTQEEIAKLITKTRPYSLSRSQVRADVAVLRQRWQSEALEMRGHEVAKALRKFDKMEAQCWDAWERSKQARARTKLVKKSAGKGSGGPSEGAGETKEAVTQTTPGDPAFIGKILEIHDRRVKLLGLAAPTKSEFSGPEGGPIPIANVAMDDEDQDAILARHFMRWKEDESQAAPSSPEA